MANSALSTVRRNGTRIFWKRTDFKRDGIARHVAWCHATDHTGATFRWELGTVWVRADATVTVEYRGVSSQWHAATVAGLDAGKALVAANADLEDSPAPVEAPAPVDAPAPAPAPEFFRLIGYPETVFQVAGRYMAAERIPSVHGVTLDGMRQTRARVADVEFCADPAAPAPVEPPHSLTDEYRDWSALYTLAGLDSEWRFDAFRPRAIGGGVCELPTTYPSMEAARAAFRRFVDANCPAAPAMVPQPVQPQQADAGEALDVEAERSLEDVNRDAATIRDGLRVVGRLYADGAAFHVEEMRNGRCVADRGRWPSYPAALGAVAAIELAAPAPGSHRAVMLALDAFDAAPWPRPLVEINPRPAAVLDVLPPAPARPFAPFLDLPAPAPRSMADVWQSLAVEFGPPLVMRRPALALRPEPRGPLDFLTIGEAFALYLAAACFGLALAMAAF